MAPGAVVDFQTVYELSRDWYDGRLAIDWARHDADSAAAIFGAHGLTGPFWELS